MSEGPYTDAEKGDMPAAQLVSLHDANGGAIKLQHNTAAAWATQVARNSALTISPLGAYRTTAQSNSIGAFGQSHGYGTCVDIYTSSANQWAIDHFPSVWVRDLYTGGAHNAANEWNHWHYKGPLSTDISTPTNPATSNTGVTVAVVIGNGSRNWLIEEFSAREITSNLPAYTKAWGDPILYEGQDNIDALIAASKANGATFAAQIAAAVAAQ
jgi:hypothetical protein